MPRPAAVPPPRLAEPFRRLLPRQDAPVPAAAPVLSAHEPPEDDAERSASDASGFRVSGVRVGPAIGIGPIRLGTVRFDEVHIPPITLPGKLRLPGVTIRAGGVSPLRLPRIRFDKDG
ncbi:hypothetical protein ONR57_14455 [Hoyosella sp. YIM 151337]|nr:hypothetical protein [Hoyosella sp. YIM 151337]MCW4354508.1 hypothetical protein [Hoyosella sp. YIM 151337]